MPAVAAASSFSSISSFFLILCSLLALTNAAPGLLKKCEFNAIYQPGDSITDTGNLVRENAFTLFGQLPFLMVKLSLKPRLADAQMDC